MLKNNNGLTLVEILATIVIFSIVISIFLSLLPQMTNLNNINQDNLSSTNIAKKLLVEMKNKKYEEIENNTLSLSNVDSLTFNKVTDEDSHPDVDTIIIKGKYESYNIEINVNSDTEDETRSLRKIQITIKNSKKILATTHGYLDK